MSKQLKKLPFFNIKSESEGRTRAGIAAVFGNIDDGADITHKGAFAKTLNEGRQRFKHLWNHDSNLPPIATIVAVKEVGREELPPEVLEYAPDATGGLYVKRDYYKNEFASWVLEAIDRGDVDEMSFAYDTVKFDFDEIEGKQVRNLRELILFDTSDVNYGMNPATLGSGMKGYTQQRPLGLIYSDLLNIENQIKAGQRNSASDQTLLDLIHKTSIELGAVCDFSQTAEDEKTNNSEQELKTSIEQAEAVNDTSLSDLGNRFQQLQIENLKTK